MNKSTQQSETILTRLLQLQTMVRNAQSLKAMQFLVVNETRRLLNYRQAFLFFHEKGLANHLVVKAGSSVSNIDERAPFVQWLQDATKECFTEASIKSIQFLDGKSCPEELKSTWGEYSMPFIVWCPLILADGTFAGGIWFARETPWQENDNIIIKNLSEMYAHGFSAVAGPDYFKKPSHRNAIAFWTAILCIFLIMYFPVRLSTLAPAKVVAKDPVVVSAPIDGVIAEIFIPPNTYVEKGTKLFRYEDIELRNQYEVAEQALSVASVELRKATQGAFLDTKIKAQVALLNAQLKLEQAELDYAKELLQKVNVYAAESGLLIFTEKSDWVGKPVMVGEHVMEIAEPEKIQIKIDVAVGDAIILKEGADVDIFLDVDPLNSLPAKVTHASYNAEPTVGDVLAYKVYASLNNNEVSVRIGLQGTGKIYGDKVSLFFYLFRRPISAARQFIGF